MFYEPRTETSGLPHSPVNSCCVPRPIGWISTLSKDGVNNLAPFSQFQNVTFDPPTVLFSSCGSPNTDTARNAEETGEFVWNMATYDLREAVNKSAEEVPPEVDEFDLSGVTKASSHAVKPCRVAESPVHFECVYHQTLRLPGNSMLSTSDVVFGRVIGIHISDDVIGADGRIDVLRIRPIARLGYHDYTSVESIFEMIIPGNNKVVLAGMDGSARD